ncbi:hypothetical protein HLB35_15725 [Halomonas sp. TBZ9]|uniref:Uncharacterized protein n=1 Tax=Vreelandella azerica TaxID=2732867 RepID=A0A7Y3TZB1_9GAMM|nr:hypothetical protein [Halomonas azerica]NOG32844.1 hypothetical protein [Halomonas azerica]
MSELETLLLRQLEKQQSDSEQLVNGLLAQLERLQTTLKEQQGDNQALRRELKESDQKNEQLFNDLAQRVNYLSDLLEHFMSVARE